ncbi:uncharacterized protein SPPG_05583 [Spizellomyces punctatus DAOM BR117]|uniref:E3 ubiquitin-protein ligase n=1 Tax=Spizellomyces punctatus (strain DAOM BR117) TaxID=645134 RepID=A0A0L0HCU2_SPIPD|nr:uncharacterized protein SPPG_05583 [Spizellomyces punctatus DAOM BR117]KNC99335.1 hypothetical protein SPPG_05583 [Spizellomyces punctatus DAOM BR117]|eukprot:XP_016607375.1 hypothetical protein SPPG_05583 [Spizellomyces punctatus DAOM BR117]
MQHHNPQPVYIPPPSILSDLPYFDDQLYAYLHESPFRHTYDLPLPDDVAEEIVLSLNKRICAGTNGSPELLFGTSSIPGVFQETETGAAVTSRVAVEPSITEIIGANATASLPPEYQESQRGKACGHVFKRGEAVYRCRNCALDETCVFCSRCFHATNHEGHDTSFSIASGTGGCCDCGDPEAWRVPINCTYHYLHPSVSSLSPSDQHNVADIAPSYTQVPEEVIAPIRSTIATVFDFILDTLMEAPVDLTLPASTEAIEEANPPETQEQSTPDGLGQPQLKFACVLWNDETHSFQEVIDQVMEAVRVDDDEAKGVAEAVDFHGRQVVKVSSQLPRLLSIARIISQIGLTVSIRSARETFREEVVGVLIGWLKNLPKQVVGVRRMTDVTYEPIDAMVRRLICEEMCANRRQIKVRFTGRMISPTLSEEEDDVAILDPAEEAHAMNDNINNERRDAQVEARRYLARSQEGQRLRIDHLLLADVKLWKEARNSLRELYIGTMIVSGDEYKRVMGFRFARNYLRIANSYLFHDREYELSIINFSVQLFTVPTIAQYLATHTNLLSTQFLILKAFYLSDVLPSQYSLKDFNGSVRLARYDIRPHYPKLRCESEAARNRRYWHLFQDIRYLLTTHRAKDSVFRGNPDIVRGFLDICRVWQGMHPQQRYTRQHVEYEDEHWVHAFNLSLQVGRQIKFAADCLGPTGNSPRDYSELQTATASTLAVLTVWCEMEQMDEIKKVLLQQGQAAGLGVNHDRRIPGKDGLHLVEVVPGKPFRVPFFRVASQPISFHHPLHWFLAQLLAHVPRVLQEIGNAELAAKALYHLFDETKIVPLLKSVGASTSEHPAPASGVDLKRVCRIMDFPLRVTVLLAQIRAGIWVRNGFNIRSQALHYRENTLRESYDQDLYLLQVFSILVGPDMFITSVLDRFDLVSWFQGRVREAAALTALEPGQLTNLAEDLLHLLIVLLTERSRICAHSLEQEMRREIIHHLAVQPQGLAYSELQKRIPERLVDSAPESPHGKSFDDVLAELSDFTFPEGMSDHGTYELKPEYYEEVDPWFWHYTRNQREEMEELLTKRAGKRPQRGPLAEEDYIRPPRLQPIPITTGHQALGNLVKGEAFVRVLFFALWNTLGRPDDKVIDVAGVKSATLVAEAIRLLMLGVQVERMERGTGSADMQLPRFIDLVTEVQISVPIGTRSGESREAKQMTLLQFLLHIMDRVTEEEIKEHTARLRWLLRSFEELGSELTRGVIAEYRQHAINERAGTPVSDTASASDERERKKVAAKAAAKARQAAIMAQFAQAQKSFMETYGDEMEEAENENDEGTGDWDTGDDLWVQGGKQEWSVDRSWKFPSGPCIFCQEDTDKGTDTYGLLGLVQPSQIQRHIDFGDTECVAGVLRTQSSLDVAWSRPTSGTSSPSKQSPQSSSINVAAGSPSSTSPGMASSLRPLLSGYPISHDIFSPGLHISTCGHVMHVNCFQQYYASVQARQTAQPTRNHPEQLDRHEYMCPLCKSLGNCLVPVLWTARKEKINWVRVESAHNGSGALDGLQGWWDSSKLGQFARRVRESIVAGTKRKAMDIDNTDEMEYTSSNMSMSTTTPEESDEALLHALEPGGIAQRFRQTVSPFIADSLPRNRRDIGGDHSTYVAHSANLNDFRPVFVRFLRVLRQMDHQLDIEIENAEPQMQGLDVMWDAFAYTVSALEIGSRGVVSKVEQRPPNGQPRIGVIDAMSPHSLTLLRVFSECILTYTNLVIQAEDMEARVRERGADLVRDVFYGFVEIPCDASDLVKMEDGDLAPFLLADLQNAFSQLCFTTLPAFGTCEMEDVFKWCGIFFVAKVVKAISGIVESVGMRGEKWADVADLGRRGRDEGQSESDEEIEMRMFVHWICENLKMRGDIRDAVMARLNMGMVAGIVRRIALVFLRFLVITIWARFGIVPPDAEDEMSDVTTGEEEEEFERLRRFLHLPSLWELCSRRTINDGFLNRLIAGWCTHVTHFDDDLFGGPPHPSLFGDPSFGPSHRDNMSQPNYDSRILLLPDPAIRELVSLPYRLDTLFEESLRRVCRKCSQVPSDPALCLICGLFVCSQSFCCQEDDRGECNTHARICGGGIGIYFIIKKCVVLLLHCDNGFFINPPYLDAHGEVDLGLRRGRPQYLNQRRYDEIRKLWLAHGVPSYVARKIEQSYDRGGWQTL